MLNPLKLILSTAVPFSLARLIQVLGDFGTVAFVALLGTQMLAACGLIIATQTMVMIPLSAILNAMVILINPNEPKQAGSILRQSWLLGLILSIFILVFFLLSKRALTFLHQPIDLIQIVSQYLCIYALSIPFFMGLYANQQFLIAIKKPFTAFVFSLVNVVLTIFFSYCFILGHFGCRPFGINGLAFANFISYLITFIGSTFYFYIYEQKYNQFCIFKKTPLFSLHLKKLLLKGMPICLFVATEIAAMSVASFIVGLLGKDALASQQAASAYLYILTSLLIAGSQATTVTVRTHIWQSNFVFANTLGSLAIKLWAIFAILTGSMLICFPHFLISIFLKDKTYSTEIVNLAALLLQIHGVGLIFDSIRNMATGNLRAIGDVKSPMFVGFVTTFGLALWLGYVLGIQYQWGAAGVYIARDIGLAMGAAILLTKWLYEIKAMQFKFKAQNSLLENKGL